MKNYLAQLTRAARRNVSTKNTSSNRTLAAVQEVESRMLGASHPAITPTANYSCPARNPMIQPRWWTGKAPLASSQYAIDCSGYDMTKKIPELEKQMIDIYRQHGVIMLTNTGLTDLEASTRWAQVIKDYVSENYSGGFGKYTGGANSRWPVAPNVYDTGAPLTAHLHYHHEMTYVSKSVPMIAFACSKHVEGKGYTYISDGFGTTDAILKTPLGQKLKEKGVCFIRCLTDKNQFKDVEVGWNGKDQKGVYNHWQTSFGVETKEEVEKLAQERGLTCEWGPNNYLKTKYKVSAFEYSPLFDRNLLYSSLADDAMWFDTWPGVDELPVFEKFEGATMHERPLKMTYGDGTEFTREELLTYIDVYDQYGLEIQWKTGDVVAIDNLRWAHGRPECILKEGEERFLGVMLGPHFDRQGCRADKW